MGKQAAKTQALGYDDLRTLPEVQAPLPGLRWCDLNCTGNVSANVFNGGVLCAQIIQGDNLQLNIVVAR